LKCWHSLPRCMEDWAGEITTGGEERQAFFFLMLILLWSRVYS
jgi:hypothetical protein